MKQRHMPSALAAVMLLAGAGDMSVGVSGSTGEGTLRRGQTRRDAKPQWLQDRLIARVAEKRARKAFRRLREAPHA